MKKIFVYTFLLLQLVPYLSKAQQEKKPNVLIIYTDQQRYNTIHALGNKHIKTPHIDDLISEGTAFTHSFVTAPVCVPSRWSLHSGMYTTTHQTYSNHHVSKKKRPATSMPLEFKKQGYQTVLVGKNHCFLNKKHMDVMIKTKKFKKKPKDKRSADEAMPWTVEEDPMHLLTSDALAVLDKQRKEDGKPVFMWLSYLYPHTPYMCPEPYFSMYNDVDIDKPAVESNGLKAAGKPFRQQFHKANTDRLKPYDEAKTMRMKRTYYSMVSMIDAEIGRLIDFLDKNNMRENTIIVFTSDHGDYMGDHGMNTKSPAMYDCLTRVPLIFSWPKTIKANQITDELASNIDVMPTLLNFIGAEIPEQVQGNSLVPLLTKGKMKKSRKYIFSEYGIPGKPLDEESLKKLIPNVEENPIDFVKGIPWEANPVSLAGRFRMIRSHDFKLVEEENGTNELYDLKKDPNELVNVYGQPEYAKVQKKMTKALKKWKKKLPGIERDKEDLATENIKNYIDKKNKSKKKNK